MWSSDGKKRVVAGCACLIKKEKEKKNLGSQVWPGRASGRANPGRAEVRCPSAPSSHTAPRRNTPTRTWTEHRRHLCPCSGTSTLYWRVRWQMQRVTDTSGWDAAYLALNQTAVSTWWDFSCPPQIWGTRRTRRSLSCLLSAQRCPWKQERQIHIRIHIHNRHYGEEISSSVFVYVCVYIYASTYRVTAPENNLSMILFEEAVRGENEKKISKGRETNGSCCKVLRIQ